MDLLINVRNGIKVLVNISNILTISKLITLILWKITEVIVLTNNYGKDFPTRKDKPDIEKKDLKLNPRNKVLVVQKDIFIVLYGIVLV